MKYWKRGLFMLVAAVVLAVSVWGTYQELSAEIASARADNSDNGSQETSRCLYGCAGCTACQSAPAVVEESLEYNPDGAAAGWLEA